MTPIERLYERAGLPCFELPPALAASYGGDFGLARPSLYANFVSSVDGVVALPAIGESGSVVSGNNEPDRFVMALLRACADAVLIGAGTFRKADGGFWHAEDVYPEAKALFVELRRQLGLRPHPLLVVVTAGGRIDRSQPSLQDALIVTTPEGEGHLRGTLPPGARIVVLDSQPIEARASARISARALKDLLEAERLHTVLTEGGPTLVGELLEAGLLDELFLTTSPRLFGRKTNDGRKALVDGVELAHTSLELVGVRRHESHLFLRYGLRDARP